MVLTEPDLESLMNEFVIVITSSELMNMNHYISGSLRRSSGGLGTKWSNSWRSETCSFAQLACFQLSVTRSTSSLSTIQLLNSNCGQATATEV